MRYDVRLLVSRFFSCHASRPSRSNASLRLGVTAHGSRLAGLLLSHVKHSLGQFPGWGPQLRKRRIWRSGVANSPQLLNARDRRRPRPGKKSGAGRTSGPSMLPETVLHFASARFPETCDLPKTTKVRPCTQRDGPSAPSRQLVMQLEGRMKGTGATGG